MSHSNETHQSFLRAIAQDQAANTIAICAASLLPLMAMVGGGVDASRYYMAETRMQAACDAGALAARRAMQDDKFKPTHRKIGENFFDQNYSEGVFGTEDLDREFTGNADGEVVGTASGTVPTSIMGALGFGDFQISVDCTADINISNTDITFVLDVTGSMAWRPDGSNCGASGGLWTECSGSRIQGLRDAVMTFYDTVEDATSPAAQVRYGVVPYSTNVNVGKLLHEANPNWLATSHTYQSREWESGGQGDYQQIDAQYIRTGGASNWRYQGTHYETQYVSRSECDNLRAVRYDIYHSSNESSWNQVSQSGSNPRITEYTGNVTYLYYRDNGSSSYSNSSGRCELRLDHWLYDATSDITITEEREETFEWVYRPVEFDLTTLYDDYQIELPVGSNGSDTTIRWDGCVEEAETVAASNFNPVPAGAHDLNINLVPSTDEERWKPVLNDLVWRRRTNSGAYTLDESRRQSQSQSFNTCPAEALRLEQIARSDMQNYVNSLVASGSTYHDFGMIWGARFTSPNGIFTAQNATAPNGDAIARHIVFMTDGELSPSNITYSMYGVEWWDRRITTDGSNTTAFNNHSERFQAACRLARQENISVWVVAFGTNLTQNLIDCATPGRAFAAADSATLESTFQEIAQQIAALRLTS